MLNQKGRPSAGVPFSVRLAQDKSQWTRKGVARIRGTLVYNKGTIHEQEVWDNMREDRPGEVPAAPGSGRRGEKEDLQIGMERCDAIVLTGEGTGLPTPMSKLASFREIVHDFPLIVGAGVTNDSIGSAIEDAEGVIVGSWLKKGHADYGEVAEEYVREIVRRAKQNWNGDLQV